MKTSRNYWPLGLFTFFGLLFIGLASVVVIAATHRESMVSDNYYEQELKFQNQIDGAARAQQAGASIMFDAAASRLVVAVPPAQLAEKFSGTIELYRPSDPNLDQTISFSPSADGTQIFDGTKLAAGLWLVRAKWNADGQNYFLEQKIAITGK